MRARFIMLLMCFVFLFTVSACSKQEEKTTNNQTNNQTNDTTNNKMNREVILKNDNTNEARNLLLKEDIEYLKKELPKKHKNLYHTMTQEEFNEMTDQLIDKIDQINNQQVFTELSKIIASVGDAHTSVNIWDGYSYPLQFWIFDGKVFVVNADKSLKDMMFSQILKIDGVDIDDVMEQLTTLISRENDSWVAAMLPGYLQSPVYLYGLGMIQNENEAVFTVEKEGEVNDFTVPALEFGEKADYINTKSKDTILGIYEKYYDYHYLSDQKALYFEYNVCANMENQSFADFNKEMFDTIEKNNIEKVIIDLRSNTGGNSEVLNPFTKRLKSYIKENDTVKVYILVGRNTFSSGIFAICRIIESAPDAISVGEPTGGALDSYGDIRMLTLPNCQIPINYCTKYFELSKGVRNINQGVQTFIPDISVQPTIQDYEIGTDAVLNYALED